MHERQKKEDKSNPHKKPTSKGSSKTPLPNGKTPLPNGKTPLNGVSKADSTPPLPTTLRFDLAKALGLKPTKTNPPDPGKINNPKDNARASDEQPGEKHTEPTNNEGKPKAQPVEASIAQQEEITAKESKNQFLSEAVPKNQQPKELEPRAQSKEDEEIVNTSPKSEKIAQAEPIPDKSQHIKKNPPNSGIANQRATVKEVQQQSQLQENTKQPNRAQSPEQRRAELAASVQTAKNRLESAHQTNITNINAKAATATQTLTNDYHTALEQLLGLEQSIPSKIDPLCRKGSVEYLTVGVKVGIEAKAIGKQYQHSITSASPQMSNNGVISALEDLDRDSYIQQWRLAQISAAGEVTAKYQSGINSEADEQAQRLTQNGQEFSSHLKGKIARAKLALKAQHEAALQEIEAEKQQEIELANAALAEKLTEIDNNRDLDRATLNEQKQIQLPLLKAAKLDEIVADNSARLQGTPAFLQQQLETALSNFQAQIELGKTQLALGLRGSLATQKAELEAAAAQAAEQVQPTWKKIASTAVDVAIGAAVAVSIGALAASGIGLPAAIGLAALIGGGGGLLKLASKDALDGKVSSWTEYGKQAAIGAGTGILQAFGVMGADRLGSMLTNQIAKTAAQIGVQGFTDTIADLGTQAVFGKPITLQSVGASFASSLLSNGGGRILSSGFGKASKSLDLDKAGNNLLKNGSSLAISAVSDVGIDYANSQIRGEEFDLTKSITGSLVGNVTGKKVLGAIAPLYGSKTNKSQHPQSQSNSESAGTSSQHMDVSTPRREKQDLRVPTGDRALKEVDGDGNNSAQSEKTPAQKEELGLNQLDETVAEARKSDTDANALKEQKSSSKDDPRRNTHLEKILAPDLRGKVPIIVDPDLEGNTVRVHYAQGPDGLITDIHMQVGPGAKSKDILLHQRTARRMQLCSGFMGKVIQVKNRLQKWLGMHSDPPIGSKAWEAKLEVDKLKRIIQAHIGQQSKMGLDVESKSDFDAQLANLESQLLRHQKTLDEMDLNPGVGYVAAEGIPLVELHNHLAGILSSDELIELSVGQGNYAQVLKDVWADTKLRSYVDQLFTKEKIITQADRDTLDLDNLEPSKLKEIAEKLFSANDDIKFGTAYFLRGKLIDRIEPEIYLNATLEKVKREGVKYVELQGEFKGIGSEQFRQMLDEKGIEVRFLENLGTGTLAKENRGVQKIVGRQANPEQNIKEIKPLEFAKNGLIGVDFAGPEAMFLDKGMKNFKQIYQCLAQKAEQLQTLIVIRPHVGEGNPNNTAINDHREQARGNLEILINTLEQIKQERGGNLSDQIVLRFGHATHATPEQLEKIREMGIIVEANLTSNLRTGSVSNDKEMNQTLLKFIYHDVKTILNTDGGGVMQTTLEREYEIAQEAIARFKANRIEIPVGNIKYYYSQLPPENERDSGYEYRLISEDRKESFDRGMERLEQNAEEYFDIVAPQIRAN